MMNLVLGMALYYLATKSDKRPKATGKHRVFTVFACVAPKSPDRAARHQIPE